MFTSNHGGNIREAGALAGVDPAQLIDFSANINPLGMPAILRRAIVDNLDAAQRYPDPEYLALHQALAAHHHLPLSWLMAGNGETELIFQLLAHLAPRHALLLTPGFAEYRRALTRVGCRITDYPLTEADGWQPDSRLLSALTPDLDCLVLCTPNNPTGLMPERELMQAIVARCAEQGIALVVDEAFIDFIPDATGCTGWLAEHPNLWILRSLTKFYAIPGLRLGYLINSDTSRMAALRASREPWTINAFAALAGEIVLNDEAYQQATFHWLETERRFLWQALNAQPSITVWPGEANYLFFRYDGEQDLQRRLLAQHILIRSCANYPGLDPRYFRVAVKSRADNEALIAALVAISHDTNRGA